MVSDTLEISKGYNYYRKIKNGVFFIYLLRKNHLSRKMCNKLMHALNGNIIYKTDNCVVKFVEWKDLAFCDKCNSWHSSFDYLTTSLTTAKNYVKPCFLAINKGYIALYIDNRTKISLYNLLPMNIMKNILDLSNIDYNISYEYLPYHQGYEISKVHQIVSFRNVTFNSCGTLWTKTKNLIFTLPGIQLSFCTTRIYKGLYFSLSDEISDQLCVFCSDPTLKYGMYKSNYAMYMLIEAPNFFDGHNYRSKTQMLSSEAPLYIDTTYPLQKKVEFSGEYFDTRYSMCTDSGKPELLKCSVVNIDFNPSYNKISMKHKRIYRANNAYFSESLLSKYIISIEWCETETILGIEVISLKNCVVKANFFNHVNTFIDLLRLPFGFYDEIGMREDYVYGRLNINEYFYPNMNEILLRQILYVIKDRHDNVKNIWRILTNSIPYTDHEIKTTFKIISCLCSSRNFKMKVKKMKVCDEIMSLAKWYSNKSGSDGCNHFKTRPTKAFCGVSHYLQIQESKLENERYYFKKIIANPLYEYSFTEKVRHLNRWVSGDQNKLYKMYLFSKKSTYEKYINSAFISVIFQKNIGVKKIKKMPFKKFFIKCIKIHSKMKHYDNLSEIYPTNVDIVILNDKSLSYSYLRLKNVFNNFILWARREEMLLNNNLRVDISEPVMQKKKKAIIEITPFRNIVLLNYTKKDAEITPGYKAMLKRWTNELIEHYRFCFGASDYIRLINSYNEVVATVGTRVIKIGDLTYNEVCLLRDVKIFLMGRLKNLYNYSLNSSIKLNIHFFGHNESKKMKGRLNYSKCNNQRGLSIVIPNSRYNKLSFSLNEKYKKTSISFSKIKVNKDSDKEMRLIFQIT
jgi:hypothetical protein